MFFSAAEEFLTKIIFKIIFPYYFLNSLIFAATILCVLSEILIWGGYCFPILPSLVLGTA